MRFVYKSIGRKLAKQHLHIVHPNDSNNSLCNSILNATRTSKDFSMDNYTFLDSIPKGIGLKACRVCLKEYEEMKSTGDSHEEEQQDLSLNVQ